MKTLRRREPLFDGESRRFHALTRAFSKPQSGEPVPTRSLAGRVAPAPSRAPAPAQVQSTQAPAVERRGWLRRVFSRKAG